MAEEYLTRFINFDDDDDTIGDIDLEGDELEEGETKDDETKDDEEEPEGIEEE